MVLCPATEEILRGEGVVMSKGIASGVDLVGRDAPLRELDRIWAGVAPASGGAVVVTGPAGIGANSLAVRFGCSRGLRLESIVDSVNGGSSWEGLVVADPQTMSIESWTAAFESLAIGTRSLVVVPVTSPRRAYDDHVRVVEERMGFVSTIALAPLAGEPLRQLAAQLTDHVRLRNRVQVYSAGLPGIAVELTCRNGGWSALSSDCVPGMINRWVSELSGDDRWALAELMAPGFIDLDRICGESGGLDAVDLLDRTRELGLLARDAFRPGRWRLASPLIERRLVPVGDAVGLAMLATA